jgi:hypothetical protein
MTILSMSNPLHRVDALFIAEDVSRFSTTAQRVGISALKIAASKIVAPIAANDVPTGHARTAQRSE